MNKLIARLIKCGMPRDVALAVCRSKGFTAERIGEAVKGSRTVTVR